jgi:hypothetical protein
VPTEGQTTYPVPPDVTADALVESGGTDLPVGAIADGQVLVRAGSAIVGTAGAAVINGYQQKFLRSPLPSTTTRLLTSGTAYWVYIGLTTREHTVNFVVLQVAGLGSGTQTAEIALASTPTGPNKTNLTLTKIYANGTLDSLTASATTKRNTVAAGQVVPAGTHLWAGFRMVMGATQLTTTALVGQGDMGQGHVLLTAASGALTDAGPWTGTLIAVGTTALGPDLGLELA